MSQASDDFSKIGFARTFFLPALLIFLIPVVSLVFFLYIQNHYDEEARNEILQEIRADASLSDRKSVV